MKRRSRELTDPKSIIAGELDSFLRATRVRRVYVADVSAPPPAMAYVTHFPRLSITLEGNHTMELAQNGPILKVSAGRGQAVLVPGNAWNRPDWSQPVKVLTFLFGARQIGISLVRKSPGQTWPDAVKISIRGLRDGVTQNLLTALLQVAAEKQKGPLARLLVESLSHACLATLTSSNAPRQRKATRTFELLCLYIHENFQLPLTRQSVAARYSLSPSHVSRLFRTEGLMQFNDYLNLVRVNRAKFILRNYVMSLKEVAASCGYSDAAYFCRVFKRISKMTPTEYRNQRTTPPPALVAAASGS
jgi:AraC-like DNA-binding protein